MYFYFLEVLLSSPVLRSPVHCSSFCMFLSSLRHRSVSLLSGGEQGRDPIPRTQHDWVVWGVWVVLLSFCPYTAFLFSLGNFQLIYSRLSSLVRFGKTENNLFLVVFQKPVLFILFCPFLFLYLVDTHDKMATIYMIQTVNTWQVGVSKSLSLSLVEAV